METTLTFIIMLFALIFSYVATSFLLLKFPQILHEKKKRKINAIHISHRGGAGEKLENTLEAFHHAVNTGTDMLEIDCHITSNEEVVVSHDNDLSRLTGHHQLISETDFQNLPSLKNNLCLDFQKDHTTVCDINHSIPLLKEVFHQFPNTPINIDIKINNDLLVQKVDDLITEYQRQDITVWGSARQNICDKLQKQNPSMPRFFSLRSVVLVTFLFYTGLLPFFPLSCSFYEIMMPHLLLRNKFRLPLGKRYRFLIHVVDRLLVNKMLFTHLKARGIPVYLWVLNEEAFWHRAFRYGATGVMTDFPEQLTEFLNRHPQYKTELQ